MSEKKQQFTVGDEVWFYPSRGEPRLTTVTGANKQTCTVEAAGAFSRYSQRDGSKWGSRSSGSYAPTSSIEPRSPERDAWIEAARMQRVERACHEEMVQRVLTAAQMPVALRDLTNEQLGALAMRLTALKAEYGL